MIPGLNPRKMAQAMKRMGINQQEIPAREVIIRTDKEEIIIRDPQVSKLDMMGQMTYQISGKEETRALQTQISEEDIQTVMEQSGADEERAKEAIKKHEGDLAAAIMDLQA